MTPEDLERMAEGFVRLRWELIARRRGGQQSGIMGAGAGTPQALALRTVVLDGPLRMGELAAALRVTVATASRTVDSLVADGLVERRPDAGDARVVQVAATRKGRREYATQKRRMEDALGGLLEELSEDERRELADALDTVNRLLVRRDR
jgi:DNA-binding MarR family transcriptional regulator